MLLGIRWGSLRAKIMAWSLLPAAAALSAVAVISTVAFQQATERVVVDRDREVTRLHAVGLASQLREHAEQLATVGRSADLLTPGASGLLDARDRLAVFDGGVLALDWAGRVIDADPPTLADTQTAWSDLDYVKRAMQSGQIAVAPDLTEGVGQAGAIGVAVPIMPTPGAPAGALVGLVRVDGEATNPFADALRNLPLGATGSVALVGGDGHAIYKSDSEASGQDLSGAPALARLRADGVGAARVPGSNGRDMLATYAMVPGTEWGLIAHDDWQGLFSASGRYGQALLLLIAIGVAVPAMAVAVGVSRVTRPIADLIAAAQEVARGDFGHKIAANTGDEIEELANQFNAMSAQLEESYATLERRVADRTAELEALTEDEHRRAEQFRVMADVGQRMTSILPLAELLDQTAEMIQGTFGYSHVGIGLVEGDEVVYRAGAGDLWDDPDFAFRPARLTVGSEGLTGWVAASGEPLLVSDVSKDPRYVLMQGSGTKSELVLPIKAKGEVIGVLDVQSDNVDSFDESDLRVLQSLANQAAIAIENARLYEGARRLAVLEERQRVARDLHDSVTQSLYGVTLYADAATRLLDAGDIATAEGHMEQLRETARDALAEMRLLIFELRPPALAKVGLVATLQARLEAVEGRTGLTTTLEADPDLRTRAEIEEALYRVAQEALNNVLKHARASNVWVIVTETDRVVTLEISDDGEGFDPRSGAAQGGLGLRSMRERIARLGGEMHIESSEGAGTRVHAEVPV